MLSNAHRLGSAFGAPAIRFSCTYTFTISRYAAEVELHAPTHRLLQIPVTIVTSYQHFRPASCGVMVLIRGELYSNLRVDVRKNQTKFEIIGKP